MLWNKVFIITTIIIIIIIIIIIVKKNGFYYIFNFFSDGIELKEVTVNPTSRVNLKDVQDKLGQLIREVGKLQEQLTAISPHVNGTFGSGQNSAHM